MGKTILFIGDSVTAADRKYGTDDLGEGFAAKIDAYMKTFYRDQDIKVINKGFDGHRAQNLLLRLEKDCLSYQPDIVTILIGANDCWKVIDSGMEHDAVVTDAFETCCREILRRIKERLPNCQIVLMEPFIIPTEQYQEGWRNALYTKIDVIRKIAREFHTLFLPLDGLFAAAGAQNGAAEYCIDNFHPIDGGHNLIAEQWIKCVWERK